MINTRVHQLLQAFKCRAVISAKHNGSRYKSYGRYSTQMWAQNLYALRSVRSQGRDARAEEVVVANAFRKKSFMPQMPACTFIEERDAIVESRRQVVEVFIRERQGVKPNDKLVGMGELPILELGILPNIAELEKREVGGSRCKSSVVHVMNKGLKVE